MRPHTAFRTAIATVVMLAGTALAKAQDLAPEGAWQDVISSQIEAFRKGDAPTAYSYAGAGFQQNFPNPRYFLHAIIASGYAPIVLSKDHSFGGFEQKDEGTVVQVVQFVGPRQEMFRAIYRVVEEEGGWRVQGVMLGMVAGVKI